MRRKNLWGARSEEVKTCKICSHSGTDGELERLREVADFCSNKIEQAIQISMSTRIT